MINGNDGSKLTPLVKRCYRCDQLIDKVSTERLVKADRTDNHYNEYCPTCANFLVAACTHRRLQLPSEADARL